MSDLLHYGVGHLENPPGRGSGRYAYGSGENPGQHRHDFLSEVDRLKRKGCSQKEIAIALLGKDATTTQLKAEIAIANAEQRRARVYEARRLMDECGGNRSEVARRMNTNESSIRKLLDEDLEASMNKYQNTADYLKDVIDKKGGVIDVGPGTNISLNVTDNTMKVAMAMLEKEGYILAKCQVPNPTDKNKKTTISVICAPGTEIKESANGQKWVDWTNNPPAMVEDYSPNQGKDYDTLKFPSSLDSSRIQIKYNEDGGAAKEGVIEIRRGTKDLDLGQSQYAQVRIAVDGNKYIKGMAIYADPKDMPPGVDVIINTQKKREVGMDGVLKPMKTNANGEIDQNNPFGALIKRGGQTFYEDPKGNYIRKGDIFVEAKKGDTGERYSLSPINKLREEGEWDTWSRNLSTQFLSKQPMKLIKQQIDLSVADKKSELADIMNLTNPVVKQKMLEDFARNCDSNMNDLSTKGFKNQAFQVILPVPKMKDNEIYAPAFKDGDTVALIRYPHGGIFEIPVLTVNNKNKEAKKIMANATDAVGITPSTAGIISGADFDGDTVVVIPMKSNHVNIATMKPFDELKNFDTKTYKLPDSAPPITNGYKQKQMGIVTNLITDMTAQGAPPEEIARAVKHSMVVIDSEKHHLDLKQSAKDSRIAELQKKYQDGGASTIFSRSNAKTLVNERKEIHDKKKMTPEEVKAYEAGKKIIRETGRMRNKTQKITDPSKMTPEELKIHKSGRDVIRYLDEKVLVQQKVKRMETVSNPYDLVRNPNDPKEKAYADYAIELMKMGDEARRVSRSIKPTPVSQQAKKIYEKEVKELDSELRLSKSNSPRERQAKITAGIRSSQYIKEHPGMDYEHKSRVRDQELQKARDEVGARRHEIDITPKQWEAIQANAISSSKLKEILTYANEDKVRNLATPKDQKIVVTQAKINLMKQMYDSGMYTQKEIAEKFNISSSSVSQYVRS